LSTRGTILLVEDNEQNRYLVTYLLQHAGFKIVPAESGLKALALVDEMVPDTILLDIQLPGMDGYQVARELRTKESLRSVPIIAVTSYAMTGDKEKALEAGCTGYIEKPINPDTFVDQVASFLKGES
jgi:two-component system, cell cycle response regulator DivK